MQRKADTLILASLDKPSLETWVQLSSLSGFGEGEVR